MAAGCRNRRGDELESDKEKGEKKKDQALYSIGVITPPVSPKCGR